MEKFKIRLLCAGNKRDYFLDGYQMQKLLNWRVIELSRVPNIGEIIDMVIGDYSIEGKVQMVYTNYCEPGNPNSDESSWGYSYALLLGELEVIDYFGKN